jgi:hypothetical protein
MENLDITKNNIEDAYLKILLAMLMQNPHIVSIKYDLTSEENLHKLDEFNAKYGDNKSIDLSKSGQVTVELEGHHDDHHHHFKTWEKVVCCVYVWKSFIHAKHEAFRFKYDTASIKMIERTMMKSLRLNLYIQTIFYYVIMFGLPIVFLREDNKGYNNWLYYIYGIYAVINMATEIIYVLMI